MASSKTLPRTSIIVRNTKTSEELNFSSTLKHTVVCFNAVVNVNLFPTGDFLVEGEPSSLSLPPDLVSHYKSNHKDDLTLSLNSEAVYVGCQLERDCSFAPAIN